MQHEEARGDDEPCADDCGPAGKLGKEKKTPQRRPENAAVLEGSKDTNSYNHFYNVTKRLSVQAYTTSEFYLTKIHVYEMVPGRYHGCMPIDQKVSKPS